jgi:hypothetical protein
MKRFDSHMPAILQEYNKLSKPPSAGAPAGLEDIGNKDYTGIADKKRGGAVQSAPNEAGYAPNSLI